MDENARTRAGRQIREARRARGWSKTQLALAAGVSPSLIAIIERGCPGASLDSIEKVARSLGGRVVLDVRIARPVSSRQDDFVHAGGIGLLRRLGVRCHRLAASEVEITIGNARGVADLFLFDPATGRLIVIEFKTEYRDHGALERQIGFYARGAADAARRLGWSPVQVVPVVVLLQTEAVELAATRNREVLGAAFPMRGRAAIRAMLDGGPAHGTGLLSLNLAAHGRRILAPLRVDGRRTEPPFADYAGAAEFLRRRR